MTVNYLVSAPTSFHTSLVKEASQINWDVSYPLPNEKREGSVIEREVYELLLLLNAEEVFLPPSKVKGNKNYLSYLDTTLKVDVLMKIGNHYLGWQVKSSLALVDSHLEKGKVTFKGKAYPLPGLIVIDHKKNSNVNWKYKLLVSIAEQAGVPIKEEVVLAISKWKPLRKLDKIPLGILKPDEVKILSTLGLVVVKSDHLQSV